MAGSAAFLEQADWHRQGLIGLLTELRSTADKALNRGQKYGISFPEHVRNTRGKAIRPLCPTLGPRFPETERASLLSFGLRIRIGPTPKLQSPLAIFTITTEGKTPDITSTRQIYSPQRTINLKSRTARYAREQRQ